MSDATTKSRVRTLTGIVQHATHGEGTRKRDLEPGDRVIVSTRNSTYCLEAVNGELFRVNGGWFDQNPSSRLVTVNGCTYGGRAIRADLVAATGLFLEFGNNVSTTRIRKVRVVRRDETRDPAPGALFN